MSDDITPVLPARSARHTEPLLGPAPIRRDGHDRRGASSHSSHHSHGSDGVEDPVDITGIHEQEVSPSKSSRNAIDLSLVTIRALMTDDFPADLRATLSAFAPLGSLIGAELLLDALEMKNVTGITWPNKRSLRQALEMTAASHGIRT